MTSNLIYNLGQELKQHRSLTAQQKKDFASVLKKGRYVEAKKLADQFVNRGVLRSSVNRVGYDIVERLIREEFQKARELCDIFRDYFWMGWLP